jgi:hypothetical protein
VRHRNTLCDNVCTLLVQTCCVRQCTDNVLTLLVLQRAACATLLLRCHDSVAQPEFAVSRRLLQPPLYLAVLAGWRVHGL